MLNVSRPAAFSTLGLMQSATAAEVVTACRSLALQWHGDRNTSDSSMERFQEYAAAYKRLVQSDDGHGVPPFALANQGHAPPGGEAANGDAYTMVGPVQLAGDV